MLSVVTLYILRAGGKQGFCCQWLEQVGNRALVLSGDTVHKSRREIGLLWSVMFNMGLTPPALAVVATSLKHTTTEE